ncbi:MAG: hypothetical protein HC831_21730 [Chloroflexia bacterium]|nr:hypothetical protein [Chloroflexia bacterium]
MNDADNLIKAVKWNDKNWLIDFLNKGADVNALNKHGETALMHSAVTGNLEIAQMLLERGAMLDIQSVEGLTALMLAADNGKKEVAELLLKNGADTKLVSLGLRTAFDYARLKAFYEIEALLKPEGPKVAFEKIYPTEKADANRIKEASKQLIDAIWSKDILKVIESLQKGADPNVETDDYFPIMLATTQGAIDIVKLLIAQGIDPDVEDSIGYTALVKACGGSQHEIAKLLIEAGAEVTDNVMMAANIHKHPAIMKLLEKAKFRVGTPDTKGMKKDEKDLFLFSAKGDVEKVKEILEKGQSPNIIEKQGGSVLYWVARKGHHKVAAELINHGAEVNYSSPNGWSPLMEASLADNPKVVELLIANNVNVNAPSAEGATALLMAVSQNNIEVAKLLINAGADKEVVVDAGYFKGKKATDIAHENNFTELIDILGK